MSAILGAFVNAVLLAGGGVLGLYLACGCRWPDRLRPPAPPQAEPEPEPRHRPVRWLPPPVIDRPAHDPDGPVHTEREVAP